MIQISGVSDPDIRINSGKAARELIADPDVLPYYDKALRERCIAPPDDLVSVPDLLSCVNVK